MRAIARSANGRPDGPGPSNPGSNPGWAASICTPSDPVLSNSPCFPSKVPFSKARIITVPYPQKTSVLIPVLFEYMGYN